MRWLLAVTTSLTTVACGGTEPRVATPTVAAAAPSRPVVPEDLQALADSVAEVPAASADPTHGTLVTALSLLAEVLEADDKPAADRLRSEATRLMRSPPNERGHADIARAALGEVLDSFARRLPHEPEATTRAAYVAARRAYAGITSTEPLRFQLDEVAATLRSLTNLAAFERGLAPLFPEREDADIAYAPQRLERATARASKLVTALAAERSWARAGRSAAAALDAFADVLSASRGAADHARWVSLIAAVRFEALQLAYEDAISVERSSRVRAGLAACVQALQALEPPPSPHFTRLVTRAESAVKRIETNTAFVFQRGIIQESFRTIADAMLIIGAPPSPEPAIPR